MAQEKEPRKTDTKNVDSKGNKPSKKITLPTMAAAAPAEVAAAEASLTAKKPRAKSAKARTTKSKSTQTAAVAPSLSRLEEAIRLRAYEIYLQRGCQPGNPHEDWAVTEREIRQYLDQITDAQA